MMHAQPALCPRPDPILAPRARGLARASGAGALALLCVFSLFACDSGPRKRARAVDPIVRDVPAVLRGTIGAECSIRGNEPVLVSGLGLIVGLNGTGGGPLPVQIQATMERELARGGIGKGGPLSDGPLAGKSPREVLRDPTCAVVLVEGVMPPGSPRAGTFDVRVRTLPGATVTSLEGGKLWTTDLHIGPVTPFGGVKARTIGQARGNVFINPFADPSGAPSNAALALATVDSPAAGSSGPRDERAADSPAPAPARRVPLSDGVTRTVGRVLAGGIVSEPLAMELVLDNPSHARAISIVQAINSRFPPAAGDEGNTARGRNDSSIAVRVPRMYKEKTEEFLQLLRFTQIDQAFPQEYAKRYADELKKSPAMADELSWCLQAVGKTAAPFLQPLYDDPELLPRLAALRAGAKLADPRATPRLMEMARSGPTALRSEVIELLGQMGPDPTINLALRELVNAKELDVRVAAYEALAARADASIDRVVMGDKFVLDTLPIGDDLVYVAQQGKPKIVLMGAGLKLAEDSLVSAWGDRLMIAVDKGADGAPEQGAPAPGAVAGPGIARLYYRDYRDHRTTTANVARDLREVVRFLARTPVPENPEPGLDLTYSEVVGALYEVQKQGGLAAPAARGSGGAGGAAFATERDRLLARLLEAQDATSVEERPESGQAVPDKLTNMMRLPTKRGTTDTPATETGERKSLVVPLSGPKKR